MHYDTRTAIIARLRRRLANIAFDRGGLLALVVLAVYLWLAPSYIVDGDNAEFSTLGATGGVAHPPGYPLYVLYLRAMSWLPGTSAAHTAALATALLGAASVPVLHAACRAWGARAAASSIAVAIFAGGPVVLRLHTGAEVFALNDLIVGVVLWLSATNGPLRGGRRAVTLAFVAGLGLCNQHTCALLAPVGILGVVRGVREAQIPRAAMVALSIVGLLLGFTPYLYLLVAPSSAASWGHPGSFADLLAHFMRVDYGGIGAFSAVPGEIDPAANLAALLWTLGRAWLWLPAALGISMLGYRTVRPGEGETRFGWAMLATSFVIAGPVLIVRFNVPPEGLGLYICQRFHLLSVVLLVIPVAAGIDLVMRWLERRLSVGAPRRRLVREGFVVTVFVAAAGLSLPHILATHSPAVEKGVVNLLKSLPERAVVIGTADDLHFGALYAQEVLGVRPDVDVVAWTMTTLPWYRAHFAGRGLTIDPHAAGEGVPSVRVARQVFASGRPLFVEISLGSILRTFQTYPHGLVFRVLPPGVPSPSLDELVALNHQLFAGFDLAYARPDAEAEYAGEMHLRYARTWDILARALTEAGRNDDARDARELVRELRPSR